MEEIRMIEFLREYNKLCKRYKMGLSSCGCCGSPYLSYKDKCIYEIYYYEDKDEVGIESYYKDEEFKHYTIEEYRKVLEEKWKKI